MSRRCDPEPGPAPCQGCAKEGRTEATPCQVCLGSGYLRWQQAVPQPDGTFVLVDAAEPCFHGCSGFWKEANPDGDGIVQGDVVRPGTVIEG